MPPNSHEAGRIATGFVIEKLVGKGCRVESKGNNLSVKSRNGNDFSIKITSLSRPNAWIIPDSKNKNSYFVLVYKPEGEVPEFFVMTQEDMQKEKNRHLDTRKRPLNEYSNPDLERKGLSFKQPDRYKDKWDSLPI